MGGNTTDDSPLFSVCVCLPVPVFPGRVGAGRCGPGGPRGPARGGGVGALLGPEGTGPALLASGFPSPVWGVGGGGGVGVVVLGGWGAGWRIGSCVLRVSGVGVGALLAVGCL